MEKPRMGEILENAKITYADGPSGSPTSPAKEAIIRLFGLIEGVIGSAINGLAFGNSIVYATRAALFADLAHAAGTLGVVYNDSTAGYNGVYVKSGASGAGSWSLTSLALPSTFAADLAGVIAAQATTAAALKASASPGALYMAGSTGTAFYDQNGLFGTGRTLYLPRDLSKQVQPDSTRFALASIGAESAVWPGMTALTLGAGTLYVVYVDTSVPGDGYKTAAYADALPPASPSLILVGFVYSGKFVSPILRTEYVESNFGAVYSALPVAIEDGIVSVPTLVSRNTEWSDTKVPTAPSVYRNIEFPSSTAAQALCFDHAAFLRGNEPLVNVAYPFSPDGSALRPLIRAYADQIIALAPLHLVGKGTPHILQNELATGKNLTVAADIVYATAVKTTITDAVLTGLGFNAGYRDASSDRVFYGGRLLDRQPGKWGFSRFYAQSDVDNDFGTSWRAYWIAEDGSLTQAAEAIAVERVLGARARSFVWWGKMPSDKRYTGFIIGVVHGASRDFRICGVQLAYGSRAKSWISRDDFPEPNSSAASRTSRSLVIAQSPTDMQLRYPPKVYVIDTQPLPIYPTQVLGGIAEGSLTRLSISGKDSNGRRISKTAGEASMMLDSREIVGSAKLLARDISAGIDRRSVVNVDVVKVLASSLAGKSLSVLCIGDSLADFAGWVVRTKQQLTALGVTPTFIGTKLSSIWNGDPADTSPSGGVTALGEGRTSRRFADYTYEKTDLMSPVAVGGEAAYLASGPAAQRLKNPFIRAATGGDPSGLVYNGYIFDLDFYLTRFGFSDPNVVVINLGTNDYRDASMTNSRNWTDHGLNVIYTQTRAAAPNAEIVFVLNAYGRGTEGDAFWATKLPDLIPRVLAFAASKSDAKLHVAPVYAHMSAEIGWPLATVSTNAGTITADVQDSVHFLEAVDEHSAVLTAMLASFAS